MPLIKRISIGLLLIVISLYFSLPFTAKFFLATSLEKSNVELTNIELSLPSYQQITEQTYKVTSASVKLKDNTEIRFSDIQLLANNIAGLPIKVQIGAVEISSEKAKK